MAVYNQMASQFSKNGKYFAQISSDGKLKIWNTLSNSFEQEFTPDFHLTSPCTCLHFIESEVPEKNGSPRKKKRKDSISVTAPNIALGTSSGLLLIYSVTKGDQDYTINSGSSQSINCLSSNDDGFVYSGADNTILVWNLHKRNISSKWLSGNEKIGAILKIPDCNKLLTASKNIKLWDISCKEVLKTFTGHSSEIGLLKYIYPKENSTDAYFISGAKGDRLLNCWNLNENISGKNAVASCLMEDIVCGLSVYVDSEGTTNLAATVRNGVVHIYQQTLNGKCTKPIKPKTTIQIVSDSQQEGTVSPIHISSALFRDDQTICIGYGNSVVQTFENIVITENKKLQCLLRKDPQKTTSKQNQASNKTRAPVVDNNVQYLTPQTSNAASKRRNDGQQEVPMEQRLENLALNKHEGTSKVPKGDNVAQLLVQGLHSKDKNILKTVLYKKDEQLIKNTVKRLPMSVIIPFVEELTSFIKGKTIATQFGCLWLKHVISVHAALLLSNPDLSGLFGDILSNFEGRLSLQQPLNRLQGRLNLLVSQVVNTSNAQEAQEDDVALLVYNDKASSDSDNDGVDFELHSDSENEWVEESTDAENGENDDSDGAGNDSDEAMSS